MSMTFPLATVICTWTWPYRSLTSGPWKVAGADELALGAALDGVALGTAPDELPAGVGGAAVGVGEVDGSDPTPASGSATAGKRSEGVRKLAINKTPKRTLVIVTEPRRVMAYPP